MQAAVQGMLDAVLRARRGPWLHPESSPAQRTDTRQPGEPQAGEAHGPAVWSSLSLAKSAARGAGVTVAAAQ